MTKEIITQELIWHNIKEYPNNMPDNGVWFVCKIKGSNNLKLVCGYKNITHEHCDAWAEVECPYYTV